MALTKKTQKLLNQAAKRAAEEGFNVWGFAICQVTGEFGVFGCEELSPDDWLHNTCSAAALFANTRGLKKQLIYDA